MSRISKAEHKQRMILRRARQNRRRPGDTRVMHPKPSVKGVPLLVSDLLAAMIKQAGIPIEFGDREVPATVDEYFAKWRAERAAA